MKVTSISTKETTKSSCFGILAELATKLQQQHKIIEGLRRFEFYSEERHELVDAENEMAGLFSGLISWLWENLDIEMGEI